MVHKILTNGCTLEQFLKEINNEMTKTEGRVQALKSRDSHRYCDIVFKGPTKVILVDININPS